jgi:N-hydroxyarylamine O-acetyltransferase
MFDLDAYLERIGLTGTPGLAQLHRAHVVGVPFENLDPHRGIPVSLDLDDLQRKLVGARRGGYCFEQNLLFMGALEALGLQVEPMLARVRVGAPAGTVRPRSHLVLRVSDGGDTWLADVGFGNGTPLEPLPFGPDGVHDQSGWQFRVTAEGPEHLLQTLSDGEWIDVYGFVPQPVPHVDIETSNWYTSTFPRSPFVTGVIVTTNRPDGTRLSLSNWSELALSESSPGGRTVTAVDPADVAGLLADRFGLSGFAMDAAGAVSYDGD